MEEIWKDIPNYNGYQASSLGRIRTYNKVSHTERHGDRHWENRILKFKPSNSINSKAIQGTGYRVSLWKEGKCKDLLVARIIATTFLENLIDTKMTVNHKDGVRTNNNISNLEWLSLSDNIKYGFENGQYKQTKTVLWNDNEILEFRSMSLAGIFLERNSGYIHNCNKNKRMAISKSGIKYYIKF